MVGEGTGGMEGRVFTPEPGAAPGASSAPTVPSHGHAEGREGLPRPELCWRRPLAPSPAAVVSTEPRHPGRQDVSGLVGGASCALSSARPAGAGPCRRSGPLGGRPACPRSPGALWCQHRSQCPGSSSPVPGAPASPGQPQGAPVSEAHSTQHWPPDPTQGVAVPRPQPRAGAWQVGLRAPRVLSRTSWVPLPSWIQPRGPWGPWGSWLWLPSFLEGLWAGGQKGQLQSAGGSVRAAGGEDPAGTLGRLRLEPSPPGGRWSLLETCS